MGILIFFLVFGVFGVWASIAPLDGAAVATGTVTVKSYKKAIQHLEGGIVSEILVRSGDFVEAGEPLLVMDNTQSLAQLEIANSQFIAHTAIESRLLAERDGLDRIETPAVLLRTDVDAQSEIDAQNGIFTARRDALNGQVEVLQQRIEQLNTRAVGLQALQTSKEEQAAFYEEELVDVRELLSQGFSDKLRLRELERNASRLRGEAAELTANIASTEVEIGEAELQILQLRREFLNEVVNNLGETQTSLRDIRERLNALQDVVSRTVVRAPVSGIVNGMQVHTVGGVIGPGTQIAEIVPQSDELIIEASVLPIDIDRVATGQEATIRFSSFASSVPAIFGEVISISADSQVDQTTGASFYLARVEVTPEGIEDLGNLVLMPGMPAEVFISTGSRTFIQYLFKPFSNALARSFTED
ncbi:MAG: HlyD family type I secretion periplasmic adaptor subunit [Pseudohongiella sp.]|nr:MAG: HlyD family type I secretion periplasmic adaptor subunit [Pseudohongiella sp.]